MSQFAIITDACGDLTPELVAQTGVEVIPMTFTLHGKEMHQYPDHRELSSSDFYAAIQSGELPTTAAINVQEFFDVFTPHLNEGCDVLYIAFSSALSSTYRNAVLAAEELAGTFPDRTILVVDSISASLGQGLLAWHAANLRSAGADLATTAQWLEEHKGQVCHWFTAEDLHHLKRGGRCSPSAAWFGTLLSIKPVLHFNERGELLPVRKARGRAASLAALVEEMEKAAVNPSEQTIFISHANDEESAKKVEQMIRETFGNTTFHIGPISPVIGSHTGQGTIALFFLANDRSV